MSLRSTKSLAETAGPRLGSHHFAPQQARPSRGARGSSLLRSEMLLTTRAPAHSLAALGSWSFVSEAPPPFCSQHAPRAHSLAALGSWLFLSRWSRCGRALSRTDTRTHTHTHTERAPPMGPPPTHVCLVRETRLLPPKAGRLASRSAKPTLDGSSLTTTGTLTRTTGITPLARRVPVASEGLGPSLAPLCLPFVC